MATASANPYIPACAVQLLCWMLPCVPSENANASTEYLFFMFMVDILSDVHALPSFG